MSTPREQFNCRIPVPTKQQIADLASAHGLSQSEIVMIAIDRLAQSLRSDPAYRDAAKKLASC